MKLLLENWRKYLTEDEAQHFPWLEDIKSVDPDELRNWMNNNSDRFIPVGRGSFRGVYVPLEDQDYVIKVVHDLDKHNLQMNKDDFETAKRYPFIFPKSYAHAHDFSWIVTDWTTPITKPDQMQKVLDQSFPAEQEAILSAAGEMKKEWEFFNPADPFHVMTMIMASFRGGNREKQPRPGYESEEDTRAWTVQDIIAPVAGPAYQELTKAMHEFHIDRYELGKGNIGHDSEGNFKIIDSSVFDPEWGDLYGEAINEAKEEPDLLRFSDELNNRISSLLLQPASSEQLNQQDTESEANVVVDTGELFANYENVNEVHLGVVINDEGTGSIKAFYLCDVEERGKSNLVIVANIPRGYETIEEFPEWLAIELEDALSHELQHSCDPTDMLAGDIPEGEDKWTSLENIYKHFASEAETRGHLAGARGRARRSGRSLEDIVDEAVDQIFQDALQYGYTVEELTPVMQAIWKEWTNYLQDWNE